MARQGKLEDPTHGYSLSTNPWKKKLIHPMMIICGTIITICFFIPSIIPSIALGSVSGFPAARAGALSFERGSGGPSLRKRPAVKECLRCEESAV